MSDSLKTRVARTLTGSAHALLDKIEDLAPMASLEQNLRELDKIADEVRLELGKNLTNRHLVQQQHLKLNEEHGGIAAALDQALAAGREDLAKAGIARQIDIEAQLPILESNLKDLLIQEHELAGFIDALMSKRREMDAAIRALEQALNPPKGGVAGPNKNPMTTQARVDSVQTSFDRTYRRQSGALSGVAGPSLAEQAKLIELNQLTLDNKINERLMALRLK